MMETVPTDRYANVREEYARQPYVTRARQVMPGGNTRTTVFAPPSPPYAASGRGCWITDRLGRRILDANNNYSSLIHGHAHPGVMAGVRNQLDMGTAFGLPTVFEIDLAERLAQRTEIERWRFHNSGTEAVMAALRCARAFTGRELIVRFEGSYHGTYDGVVGHRALGVPAAVADTSVELPQRDGAEFEEMMTRRGGEVAAVLLDLMPNRAGLVRASPEFVGEVCKRCCDAGALLVIDEVITYRLALGGLAATYDVTPDLMVVGKIIGGGFPIGAVGGRREVMEVFDPTRQPHVSWGGTFNANPISMIAGAAALDVFDAGEIDRLNRLGDQLRDDLADRGVKVHGYGSLMQIREVGDVRELWWRLYEEGVLAGNNGLLALSTPMDEGVVAQLAAGVAAAMRGVAVGG